MKNFALDVTGTFIIKCSLDNLIVDVNDTFVQISNYEKKEVLNKMRIEDLICEDFKSDFKDFLSIIYKENISKTNINLIGKDNTRINVDMVGKIHKNSLSKTYYIFICHVLSHETHTKPIDNIDMVYLDLEADKNLFRNNAFTFENNLDKINDLKERYTSIIDSTNIGLLEIDLNKNNFYCNEKCKEILQYNESFTDDIKHSFADKFSNCIVKDDYYKLLKMINTTIKNKKDDFKINIRIVDKNNETRWIDFFGRIFYEDNKVQKMICLLNDITNSRIYQNKIDKLAYSDGLTGLKNKTYMQEKTDNLLKAYYDKKCALILFDIDDFRFINDSFGHQVGDKVIIEISERLRLISNKKDFIVSRFSGNELAIFYINYKTDMELDNYVDQLKKTLNKSYDQLGISYSLAVSLGIAISPIHGNTFGELYKHAEIAMKEAKDTGRNRHLMFNKNMKDDLEKRVRIENDLRSSIDKEEDMILFLQPQYRLSTEKISGFEALLRWKDSKGNFISPNIFIPIAEETRLIIPIGNWVLRESCKILKKLEDQGYDHIKISINLSPVQLLDAFLIDNVKDAIKDSKVNPENLVLEITETAVMENLDANIKKLIDLTKLGIKIALDDFGTGYSSLTYLKILPISTIKIDKSFIENITNSTIDKEIIEKIIDLSHILNLVTVAEGVETIEQLEFIKHIGCDIIQGYIAGGPPIEAVQVSTLLNKKIDFNMGLKEKVSH